MDLINELKSLGFKKIDCPVIENERDISTFRRSLKPLGFLQCGGVYMFVGLNPNGVLRSIYVGCSGNIYNRLRNHHIPSQAIYDKRYTKIEVFYRESEHYMWVEEAIIGEFRPAFNLTSKFSQPENIARLKLESTIH